MRTTWIIAALAIFAASQHTLHAQQKPQPKPKLTPEQSQAMSRIRQIGGLVMELAQNDSRLVVGLHLTDQKVTDDVLAVLKDLPPIVQLNLRGTEVTDAGLPHLKPLTALERLHLERTKVTDAGLVHLAELQNLQYLNLYGTEVTDAGLEHLAALKNLKNLYLWETKTTEEGIARLRQALPGAEIVKEFVPAKPRFDEEPAVAQKPQPPK